VEQRRRIEDMCKEPEGSRYMHGKKLQENTSYIRVGGWEDNKKLERGGGRLRWVVRRDC